MPIAFPSRSPSAASTPRPPRVWRQVTGRSLLVLLLAQAFTLFVAVPLAASHLSGLVLADLCRLTFAGVCIRVFTRNRLVRALLVAGLVAMIAIPALAGHAGSYHSLVRQHEWLTWIVAVFNLTVTALEGATSSALAAWALTGCWGRS